MSPQLQNRAAQPYVGIPAHVTSEREFRRAADTGFPDLFEWLGAQGIEPAGPPLIRYLAFDERSDPLDIEVAVPVAAGVTGRGPVRAGVLPSGRYVTLLHVGPYRSASEPDLGAAHAALGEWAAEQGIALDRRNEEVGTTVGCCVERYVNGPAEDPDHSKWETELAYLTAKG